MKKDETVTNLKTLLEDVGLTQVWAAKKLDISSAYLNRVLSGEKLPSNDLAEKMKNLCSTLKSSGLVKAI